MAEAEAEAAGGGGRQAANASRVHRHVRIAVNVVRLRGGGDVAGGGVLEDGAVEVACHAGGDALEAAALGAGDGAGG